METKKISKWDAAPESFKNLRNYISESWVNYAAPPCCPPLDPSCQDSICESMMTLLESVLDDYNELEAKHQLDCGLISDYEEENRNLKSELDIIRNENDCLISRVFKQDEEYQALNDCLNIQLHNLREKLKEAERSKENWHAKWTELSDICSRNEDDYEMLQRMLEKDGYTVEYDDNIDDETVHCRCTSDDILRGTTPDEVTLQFGRWTLKRPQTFSEAEANAKVAKLTAKLTESESDLAELKKKYETQKEKNIELASKNRALGMEISERCKQKVKVKYCDNKLTKLVSALGRCHMDAQWDHENDKWRIYVRPSDTELTGVSFDLCEVIEGYDKLKEENNNLITDTKRLSNAVEAWHSMFDDIRRKRDFLKKENDTLKKKINAIYGYRDTDNPCGICKNFDPKE